MSHNDTMVRFSAHHIDDDAVPMEWTTIPDEEDDDLMMSCSFSRFGLGQLQSRGNTPGIINANVNTVEMNGSGQEIICLCDSDSQDDADHANGNVSANHPQMVPTTSRELHNALQTMHDDHMNQRLFMEHQYRGRRRRRFISVVTVLAFVAVILYKYAPPPPPLKMMPLSHSRIGQESAIRSMIRTFIGTASPIESVGEHTYLQREAMHHHDSWSSYCRDTFQIFTDASIHQLSVFWYALSNAFSYAAKEVQVGFMNYVKQYTRWSTNDAEQARDDLGKQNAFSEMWCPIRVQAAGNLHMSLPKGANSYAPSNDIKNLLPASTEEFLRQSIGASLSPQNLAIILLAEGIDSWGKSLIQAAPVSLIHRMSAAMETGSWIQEVTKDDYSNRWLFPPATGVLLVGAEGVGKLHTARLLSRWLFGHCSAFDSRNDLEIAPTCQSESEETQQYCLDDSVDKSRESLYRGVLEIMVEEYAHNQESDTETEYDDAYSIKEMIVNHIIQRQHEGSVVILHHIEALPLELLSELSLVINGKTRHLSYTNLSDVELSASTDGTVFIFTTKQWGTKNIFDEIQRNGMKTKGLRRDSLLNSVRWEIDSHVRYWSKMSSVSYYLIWL